MKSPADQSAHTTPPARRVVHPQPELMSGSCGPGWPTRPRLLKAGDHRCVPPRLASKLHFKCFLCLPRSLGLCFLPGWYISHPKFRSFELSFLCIVLVWFDEGTGVSVHLNIARADFRPGLNSSPTAEGISTWLHLWPAVLICVKTATLI